MRCIFFLLFCFSVQLAPARPVDTTVSLIDRQHHQVPLAERSFIRKSWKKAGRWHFREFYPNGRLFRTAVCSDDSLRKYEGTFMEYYPDGRLSAQHYYAAGKKEGVSRRWYENGQIADSEHYINDALDGPQNWYYENGIKSEEGIYKAGRPQGSIFRNPDGSADPAGSSEYRWPSFLEENTIDGHKITRTQGEYLNSEVRYPDASRNEGNEGRVHVVFTIRRDGQISDCRIGRSSGFRDLDTEALRVICNMPPWRPSSYHNRPVLFYQSLPFTFRIH